MYRCPIQAPCLSNNDPPSALLLKQNAAAGGSFSLSKISRVIRFLDPLLWQHCGGIDTCISPGHDPALCPYTSRPNPSALCSAFWHFLSGRLYPSALYQWRTDLPTFVKELWLSGVLHFLDQKNIFLRIKDSMFFSPMTALCSRLKKPVLPVLLYSALYFESTFTSVLPLMETLGSKMLHKGTKTILKFYTTAINQSGYQSLFSEHTW